MASNTRILSGALLEKASTISTTAAVIPTAGNYGGRRSVLLQNRGSASVFIGSSSVTASTGVEVAAGDLIELQLAASVTLYGVTSSGSADVRTLEGY